MSRMKLVAASLACAAVVVLLAGRTQAYSAFAKWSSNSVVFYINPANADVDAGAAEAAIQAGMNAWNTDGRSGFSYVYGGRVGDTNTGYDGRNVVVFRNSSNGAALATTYSWWSGTTMLDSDIIFWDGAYTFYTGTDGCSGGAYIEDVATHELGHALGLNHSADGSATMYPSYWYCSIDMRSLEADDIAGLQSLYGTGGATNSAPSISISSPTTTSFQSGAAITFSGSSSDKEDGSLTPRMIWRSSLAGQIGTGGSFATSLSAGTHVITASVTDNGGLTSSKQLSITVTAPTNTAPSVTISSPTTTSFSYGATISFAGSATDTQDGNLSGGMVWTSNLVGQIGAGGGFVASLPSGVHAITATVTDSGGLTSSKQITVTVGAFNSPPAVTIVSPVSTTFDAGSAISFSGSATDSQDGNLTSRLVWQSSLQGQFGNGGSFAMTLTAGTHVITASATDNAGATSSQQVTISVQVPVTATVLGTPTLTATGYKVKGQQRADLKWSGATVAAVDVFRNGVRIATVTNSGFWTDAINNKGGGSYRYKLCEAGSSNCSADVAVTF